MLERIYELANTFSEEAQKSALDKCAELNLDTAKGELTLEESFINLNVSRLLLIDAIEKEKLIQLPITVQNAIVAQLEKISTSLTKLHAGGDEIANLVVQIEALNTAIWQYGLHNLSEEVLGYQSKLNQIKTLELEIKKLKNELSSGLSIKSDLETILSDAVNKNTSIQEILTDSQQKSVTIDEKLGSSTEADQQVIAKLGTVTQNEASASELLANVKAKNEEVASITTTIKDFHSEVNQYKLKINETGETAESTITKNKEDTELLINTLQKLEEAIKVQIEKATGFSLFHSFQTRQNMLGKVKWIWAGLILILLGGTAYWAKWLSAHDLFNTAFYLKLSMSLPLIYAITFCTRQYSHERRLEEEYAFKSNISVSLVPYKDLIEKIIENISDDKKTDELQKYSAFLINSINNVFTSPTELVFSYKDKRELGSKEIKELLSQLSPLLKALGK